MSHKRTKSDDERLLAALAALDLGQNPNSSNMTQEPVSSSEAAAAGNIEGAQNQAHTVPTDSSHRMSSQGATTNHSKSNASHVSISNFNESSSIPAATKVTKMDYTENIDPFTPSCETNAKRMGQKQETLQRVSKASTATTERLADTVQDFRGGNDLGLTRAQTVKQQLEYSAVAAQHNSSHGYSHHNELGLMRAETVKQQAAYRAATLHQSVPSENYSYDYAGGNEQGLTRVETVKQLTAYRAAMLQQNDMHVLHGKDGDRESGAGIIEDGQGRAANALGMARPAVVTFVPNDDENAAELHDPSRGTRSRYNIPIARPIQDSQEQRLANVHLVADAEPVTPFYKQTRFLMLILGLIVGATGASVAYMLVERSEKAGSSNTNIPSAAPSSMGIPSAAPSSMASILQQTALVQLYESTNGESWSSKAGWLSTVSVCNWYGVTCSVDIVTSLDLYENNLDGSIPTEIGYLTNLEYLNLQNNNLIGSIPTEICYLTKLEHLILLSNSLKLSIPTEIGYLTKLEHLDLGSNSLKGPIPTEIGHLTKLEHLDLGSNSLNGSIPAEIGGLSSLQIMYLRINRISGPIPTVIGDLDSLRIMYLHNNDLTGSIPTEIGDMSSLQKTDLAANNLNGTIPIEIGSLPNIVRIVVRDNSLAGSIPTEIGQLTQLKYLYVYRNSLTGSIPTDLGRLSSLENLSVYTNRLTGVMPNEVCNLRTINGGAMYSLAADCEEIECSCCTRCCVDDSCADV
eukprot:CAMPEP_0196806136 /NCGR_PEP_ID=MMETSP1362-20130617/6000_1 /TAXON_ID=163516 /ORGANISM="Leptocylindrus danicus, Strain CCMP1856" /LENGTH=742 /DNA_ID=CAMNT_0042179461 /DNA_START=90 /DNA_END=2318 /DNA_ORIENTATION=-